MSGEIGGYLELETLSGSEYYPEAAGLNSARNALLYILRARQIKKICIPYFLCDAVSNMLDREGIAYSYYHVGTEFLPDPDFSPRSDITVYLVNYYGQLSNERILELKSRFHSIIVDNVQAFYQAPAEEVDTVYSCRKYFGVPDGGYAVSSARFPELLQEESAMNRMGHLLGRFETEKASVYYPLYQESEARYEDAPLRLMSRVAHNILRAIDYDRVRMCREENYKVLAASLDRINGMSFDLPIGPYAYPFYTENGPILRKRLAAEKIYIPLLWPNVLQCGNEVERRLAENILPLPCDQRYGREQMKRIIESVMENLA